MNILELAILKKMVGGGGGSGTDNYNDLSNLPQINGETLAGNKTAENLGLQDALTFDSTPTEDSTNPVESGGVYNALAGKQDNLTFDGTYDASTNKAATESTVTDAINELDVSETSFDADETIDTISETDGKIAVTKKDIAIASNQVTSMTGYTKPSSAPATPAIQTNDTANQAFGKLEFKADTNQTNILYSLQNGVKNLFNLEADEKWSYSLSSQTVDTKTGTISITSNSDWARVGIPITLPAGNYVISGNVTNLVGNALLMGNTEKYDSGTAVFTNIEITTTGTFTANFTLNSATTFWVTLYANYSESVVSNSVTITGMMICTKATWDQEPNVFRPFALPNYDLTRLEAEDRAALVEQVDEGAKNILDEWNEILKNLSTSGNSVTVHGITYTNANGTITMSGTADNPSDNDAILFLLVDTMKLSNGSYVISWRSKSISNARINVKYLNMSETIQSTDSAIELPSNRTDSASMWISIPNGTTVSGSIDIMICTLADWKVSQNFSGHTLSNYQLTQEVNVLHERTDQIQPALSFDAEVPGWYRVFTLGSVPSVVAVGAYDNSCDIVIKRLFANTNNEHHEIKLGSLFENMKFSDECSKSAVLLINNIRYVSTDDTAYIDIYYSGSVANRIICFINNNVGTPWKAVETVSRVPETTTGETIWASYSFIDNYLSPNDPVYIDTGSLNDLTENKLYYAGANVTDKPTSDWGFVRNTKSDSNTGMQEFISLGTSSDAYIRTKVSGTWQAWKQITNAIIYRGNNLGDTLTDAQHTALSSGNFTDLYLGDYWTKSVTIPDFYELTTAEPSDWATAYTSYYTKSGDTYTAVTGSSAPTWAADTYYQKSVPTQTVTLKAVIADFDTFYAGYNSTYAAINTHHAAVIVTGFNNVVWNKTNTTAGGYVNSLIHKWLVGSVLPEIETWFGSAKVLSHQKLLTNAITGDAASGWTWSSQKISLLSECQLYGMKVWGGSKATNGAYEPGEAFKHLNVFNHIDANLLFGNKNIWLRDIASAGRVADLGNSGYADNSDASYTWVAPAALILLS